MDSTAVVLVVDADAAGTEVHNFCFFVVDGTQHGSVLSSLTANSSPESDASSDYDMSASSQKYSDNSCSSEDE